MEVGQLLIQSLPITTNIVRSNLTQATQHVLVEEIGGTGENHRPVASHSQTLSHNVVLPE
jgi:hypothetical protein